MQRISSQHATRQAKPFACLLHNTRKPPLCLLISLELPLSSFHIVTVNVNVNVSSMAPINTNSSFRNSLFGKKARAAGGRALMRVAKSSRRAVKELYKLTRPGEIRKARNVSNTENTGIELLPDFPLDEYVRSSEPKQRKLLTQWEEKCIRARGIFQRMREEKEAKEEEGRHDLANLAKTQKKIAKLQKKEKRLTDKLDDDMEFMVKHERLAREGLDNVDEVETQMEYARNIRPENIRFAGKPINAIQREKRIRKPEDIDGLNYRDTVEVISDLFDGGIILNENYNGPEKVISSKKKGVTVEQSKAVIAQMLQIEWPRNGAADAVAPAVAEPVALAGVAKAPAPGLSGDRSPSDDDSSSDGSTFANRASAAGAKRGSSSDDDSSSDGSTSANRASASGAKRGRDESDTDSEDGHAPKKFKSQRFSM